jgi:hypothetical protein
MDQVSYPVRISATPPYIMAPLEEHTILCPYCGETLEVLIDPQEAGHGYIEDCQVCCRPIRFQVHTDPDGMLEVTLYREDDA